MDAYDYIVVGTGSAGSVLAARLSEMEDASILVLEAGGNDTNPWIHIPVGYVKTLDSDRLNWKFGIEAEDYTHNRPMNLPRGRVVGGSSSINGMLYVRGNARDYDDWAQMGNRGWSYADVLPYFRKTENRRGSGRDQPGDFHGTAGPLTVSDMASEDELMDAVIRSAEAIGYPHNPDYNGATQDGFAYFQVTQRNGRRQSAYRAFLKPALARQNIHLVTDARAERIHLDGKRATGVDYLQGGARRSAEARREVIVCAGAVQSPQLLELSGIGQPELLRRHGIDVAHALPGVGENYRDHYSAKMVWRINRAISLNERTRGLRLAREVLRYAVSRRGVLTVPPGVVTGFVRTRPELEAPDVQYHVVPASFSDPVKRILEREPGLTMSTYQMRPESMGSIHIRSPDLSDQPAIVGNYLSNDFDRASMIGGLKISREVMQQSPISGYVVREIEPGPDVNTDDEYLDFARRRGVAIYHPVGTCKMGQDTMAVVDEQLRVHGMEGLRVVDASVMPTLTSGNTHAPTMMIAEKAADMIKAGTG